LTPLNIQDVIQKIRGFDFSAIKGYSREVIAFFILLFSTILFFQKIYAPSKAELIIQKGLESKIGREVEGIKREIREIPRLEVRLRKLDDNLERIEKRFMLLQGKLPSRQQISGVLKELTNVAPKSTVRFASIRPLPIEDRGEYMRLPFQIAMNGRYSSFGNYLRRIESLPRVLTVDNIRLNTTDATAPTLAIQIYISAYMLDEGSVMAVAALNDEKEGTR
jgi:type IV pilus assembly protein PilO